MNRKKLAGIGLALAAAVGLGLAPTGAANAAPARAMYTYTYTTSTDVPCYFYWSNGNYAGYAWVKWTIVYRDDNRRKIDTIYVNPSNTNPWPWQRFAAHQSVHSTPTSWIGNGIDITYLSRYSLTFGPTSDTSMGWYSNGTAADLHVSLYNGDTDCTVVHAY
jgi:hypothetical protein